MKTPNELKGLRQSHLDELSRLDKAMKKEQSNIQYYNDCIRTVTHMSEESLVSQLNEVKSKLNTIESKYDDWLKNTPSIEYGKDPLGTYRRKNRYAILMRQKKFLEYLLY